MGLTDGPGGRVCGGEDGQGRPINGHGELELSLLLAALHARDQTLEECNLGHICRRRLLLRLLRLLQLLLLLFHGLLGRQFQHSRGAHLRRRFTILWWRRRLRQRVHAS
jgi:hypothetical protein